MSRNRKEMSKDIFRRIVSSAVADDPNYPVDQNDRWIARKDRADANLMAEAKVSVKRLGQRELTAIIEHQGQYFFCATGFQKPLSLPSELREEEPTPGLLSLMICEGNILSCAKASLARDYLQDIHSNNPSYIGHELDIVAEFFPDILFYRIEDVRNTPYANNIESLTGSFVVRARAEYPLDLSSHTREKLAQVFECGSDSIPYSLILQGVMSYSWSALFLDLYRSIEQLYSVPRLKCLPLQFRQLGALSELSEVFENFLAWRPREEEALTLLLQGTSDQTRQQIISAFCFDLDPRPEATPAKCAAHIYKTRNSCVHFRPATKQKEWSPTEWGRIVSAMCDAVLETYDQFGSDFLLPPKLEN